MFTFSCLEGAWVLHEGKLINEDKFATFSCDEHYALALKAYQIQDWNTAAKHFGIVNLNFPHSTVGPESAFFQGICFYEQEEFEFANEAFNTYLKGSSQPQFFQEAMDYKFAIANAFASGSRRRFFGTKQLPKVLPARNIAMQIYDEMIQTMPCHDYAAQSLWAKGNLLWEDYAYQDSIDCFQTLIRRFPKHELTPRSYVAINQVYLTEAKWEFQNPDLLQLAEINLRRFEQDFPRDDRLIEAKQNLDLLKETYASGLWTTGNFYEGQGAPQAAIIYYLNAAKKFPDTRIAEKCKERLEKIQNVAL